MAEFIEFPKYLYRGLDALLVETPADEKAAIKDGWKTADKRGPAELPNEIFKDGRIVTDDLFAAPEPTAEEA